MKVLLFIGCSLIGLGSTLSPAASSDDRPGSANLALTPTPARLTPTLSPSSPNETRLEPTNFVARLLVAQLPTSLNDAPQAINGMAMTALSLAGMAVDPDLLQDAWVSFDAPHQQWKALWPKPPMFHYGMVLMPALVRKLSTGQSLNFESQGQNASLVKDDKGQLIVKRANSSSPLTANDLRDLLRARITSDGMCLFLDKSGNLVLEATGQRALALGSVKTSAKQP